MSVWWLIPAAAWGFSVGVLAYHHLLGKPMARLLGWGDSA